MSNFLDYLKGVKSQIGITSDRAFALQVGITASAMSNIMSGASIPSDETCVRIAGLVDDEAAMVISLAHRSKAQGEAKRAWDKIFKAVAAAALVAVMFVSVSAQAQIIKPFDGMYIMSNNRNSSHQTVNSGLINRDNVLDDFSP